MLLLAITFSWAISPAILAQEKVDFRRDIRPILSDKCFLCHGPDSADRKADLRLDTQEGAHEDAIVPGNLDESEFWLRITSDDASDKMPPANSHKELDKKEIELLRNWILQGAKYEQHWAYRKPIQPEVPKIEDSRFSKTAIDSFIYKRMLQAGLKPSSRAQKESLIRRVTLDLTGLPPTIGEIDHFLNDQSENAYEKVVDRLLSSRHYGERMAVDWMDISRYGDTSVFHADGPRDMWRWRDWVVNSFNNNMPYDDFTVKQLAGDLLPNPTVEDRVATGFNRNNASTDEGGAIAEEFRVEYVVDRVKTTSMVWLGLSMECAQCHDHKYDPISQEEYYKFYAFFNQAADPGMQTRNGNQKPLVNVPNEANLQLVPEVEREIVSCKKRIASLYVESKNSFSEWEVAARKRVAEPPPSDATNHFTLEAANKKKITDELNSKIVGELVGNPKFEPGKVGKAFRSNNKNYIKLPAVGDFERSDAFSFGCWVFFDRRPAGSPIAKMNDGNSHRGWDLFLHGDGRVEAHLVHQWPNNTINVIGPGKLKSKTWHHLFVTYDGSSKASGLKIYVDGKPIAAKPQHDSLSKTIKTTVPFTVGRRTPNFVFNGRVDDVKIFARQLSDREVGLLAGMDPAAPLLKIDPAKRNANQTKQLHTIYLQQENKDYQKEQKQLAGLERRLSDLKKPLTTVMVMQDLPKMRQTYVLDRGQYDSPNKKKPVSPGVPSFLPAIPESLPKNRLGMAQWLVDEQNPLTARVTVNRIWRMFFGKGIVETAEDFGSQGQWPTHPELLDWMATDFVGHNWDVKRLVKQIVMSETYCQSSRIDPRAYEIDPGNKWLSRGPRFRLSGEFIRDQALAVSGLLNRQLGGPGVKPYQPMGLWNEVSLQGNLRFRQDKGEKLYRRSLYTYWKRSAPPPSMTIFDAPTREKCTIRRGVTNTPLQALVLLNDPQFVEASRFLAERILKEGGETTETKIEFLMRTVTSRKPNEKAVRLLTSIFKKELGVFQAHPDKAKSLLEIGEKPRDQKLNAAEHAAWTVISSMILNLDESVNRG